MPCAAKKRTAWCGESATRTSGSLDDLVGAERADREEPDEHDRPEDVPDRAGPALLHREEDRTG